MANTQHRDGNVLSRPAFLGGLRSPNARSTLRYGFLIVVWGVVWPLSKIALASCPPVLFAGLRVMIGGIVLLPWAIRGLDRESVGVNLILALLNVFFFYGLQNIALQYEPAGLISILVYIQPVVTAVLARLWLKEWLTPVKLVGIILGFLGVAFISAGQLDVREVGGLAVAAGLAAGFSWGLGTVVYKKFRRHPRPVHDVGIQFAVGGVLLLGLGSVTEHWGTVHWSGVFVADLLCVGLLGTALAWIIWSGLVQAGEASRVAAWSFLVPVLATVLSVWWMGEPLTTGLVAGGVSVMVGLYLINGVKRVAGGR
ncbi:DMT family transporter [Sulfobacillus harzensis]|uniref:DMT family transporter n=1 Tax=Sulfobacillus harzensis TaxID=2729629 RepID=A0A7Y0Q308_9FIRM|nr:DMT family transporter [Sulfobacillus harzensis]NMP23718.1 DMT family transporter [Sulfobacillus harzensis]